MSKLTPSKIFDQVTNNVITEKEGLKHLESLINTSDEEKSRVDAIEFLGRLSKDLKNKISIIENCLISDESEIVRFAAAKFLIENYSNEGIDPLLWAIDSEESIFFLKQILDLLELEDNQDLLNIQKRILNKISKTYGLNIDDSKFILDIDYLDYLKFKNEFDEFLDKFQLSDTEIADIIKENSNVGFKGLARVKSINNGYITHLSLKDLREIPQSICNLTKLEILEISYCNIKEMQNSCPSLFSIRYLKLKNNHMEYIPDWMINYVKNDLNNQKYITSGVNVSEAYILGLLEALTGFQCKKVVDFNNKLRNYPYYKLDENGNIIGLYYSNTNYWMGVFPLEICCLTNLRELHLINQKIQSVPDSISNLKLLEILDFTNNNIDKIPDSLVELKNARLLDFRGNSIKEVSATLQNLIILKL